MTKSLRRWVLQLSAMKRYDFGTVSKAQNLGEKLFFWENSMFMLTFCQRNDVTNQIQLCLPYLVQDAVVACFFFVKGSTWSAGDPRYVEMYLVPWDFLECGSSVLFPLQSNYTSYDTLYSICPVRLTEPNKILYTKQEVHWKFTVQCTTYFGLCLYCPSSVMGN